MNPRRRLCLQRASLAAMVASASPPGRAQTDSSPAPGAMTETTADDDRISAGRALVFPRDHGAHPGARIEWWYATGWLQADGGGLFGFQLTFFRSRTGLAEGLPGRFAPRQLLFAHGAITDVAGHRHAHAQRLLRWSGDEGLPEAHARRADTDLALGRWTLRRQPGSSGDAAPYPATYPAIYAANLPAPEAGFTLALQLQTTQPLLRQGQAGFSRKGPLPSQASHYYSQPQLAVTASLALGGRPQAMQGRGWLDHEWSDALLAPGATGWDWLGINLADGGALTAFVLRRTDGSVLWAGGSPRPAGGTLVRSFSPAEVVFEPQRVWRSPATGTRYPVAWRVTTPLGRMELLALLDDQELDSRASTGTVYWEGLAELRAPGGGRIGLGYLEMTGRLQALRLGL